MPWSRIANALQRRFPRHSGLRPRLRRLHRARRRAAARLRDPLVWLASRLLPRSFLADPRYFELWQRRGVHALRVHYYSPVPDTRELDASLWEREARCPGVELREEAQLELLARLEARFRSEWEAIPVERGEDPTRFCLENSSFRAVDAEILYGLIRERGPRRMIEVGSGHSTLLAAQAVRANAAESRPCELVAVEPYPDAKLTRALDAGLEGLARVEERPVQSLPFAELEALGPGDLLFIDSTHVLHIGSDVQHEILEVLPRLARGVAVHFHDVFLPAEYPRHDVLRYARFWNEQYALQAFLAFNERFRVLWASHWMERRHPERLREAIPGFADGRFTGGTSFWIERVA